MAVVDIEPRIEAARQAAERARMHAQAAIDELEAAHADAAISQLAAEQRQNVAEASLLAMEAARDAAKAAQLAAETARTVAETAQAGAESSRAVAEAARSVAVTTLLAAEAARDAAEAARAVAEEGARDVALAQGRLQDFLAMAAHDLRSPLTAIAGYTDLLVDPSLPPNGRDAAAAAIQTAVLQMDRLVQDIVDAGRLGAGAFHLRPEPLDLVSLVRRVAAGQQTTSGRHRVVIDAPERLDGKWDPDRLSQVMINLISNAIKYGRAGGEVRVSVRQEQETAVVSVSDQGRGIRAADLPLLFRPFTRLLTPDERAQVGGTGLGLYISHGIIRAHGGSISATSPGPGRGSTFTISVPLAGPAPAATSGPEPG